MFGLYDRLFPPDDPKARHRWRSTIGNTVFVLILFSGFVSSALFFDLPKIGSVAWANDIDKKVVEKVTEAVKPIEQKVSVIESAVKENSQTTKLLMAKVIADQLEQLVRRRCRSGDVDEITYLSREIRRYLDDYERSQLRVYPMPTCEEVGFKEKVR